MVEGNDTLTISRNEFIKNRTIDKKYRIEVIKETTKFKKTEEQPEYKYVKADRMSILDKIKKVVKK